MNPFKQAEIERLNQVKQTIEARISELESDITPIKLVVGRTREEIVLPTDGRHQTTFEVNGTISFWFDSEHQKWRVRTPVSTRVRQIQ